MNSAFSFLPTWPDTVAPVLQAGVLLLAAGLSGEFAWRKWRLPRASAYGVIGLLAGLLGGVSLAPTVRDMARTVLDVALGLLLFELGSRLSLRWIRNNPWLIVTSLAEASLTFVLVWLGLRALGCDAMVSSIAAGIAISTSPSVVVHVRGELRSEGQVTERLMTLAALNSAYAVIVVKLVSAGLHQVFYGNAFASILQPLYLIAGSLALAWLLARAGNLLFRHLPPRDDPSSVAMLGLVLTTIGLTAIFKLSVVLTLLAAGILFKNAVARPQLWTSGFGAIGGLLTVVLFVLTLLPVEGGDFVVGGVGALILILARLLAKTVAVTGLARPSGIAWRQGAALSLCLMPMSALALVLAEETYDLYPGISPSLRAIVMVAIVVLQLGGPLLVARSLAVCGERAD